VPSFPLCFGVHPFSGSRRHTARELQNHVDVAAVEARFLELKVFSQQLEENDRLKAQSSEPRQGEAAGAQESGAPGEGDGARRQRQGNWGRVKSLEVEAASLQKSTAGLEEEN